MKKNFLEILKKSLKNNIYALVSPGEYFASRVKDAIKGFSTDDSLLIRILIIRDEFDIPQIKQYYKQLYGKDMIENIKNDIGGDKVNDWVVFSLKIINFFLVFLGFFYCFCLRF